MSNLQPKKKVKLRGAQLNLLALENVKNATIHINRCQNLSKSSKIEMRLNAVLSCFSVTHTPQNFMEFYNELWSLRDKRVDNWLLMSSPWPTISLSVAYWYCCIVLGPALMKDRKPLELKWTMQIYNFFSVVLSAYTFWECGMAGWFTHYNWKCQPVEMDTDPNSP